MEDGVVEGVEYNKIVEMADCFLEISIEISIDICVRGIKLVSVISVISVFPRGIQFDMLGKIGIGEIKLERGNENAKFKRNIRLINVKQPLFSI